MNKNKASLYKSLMYLMNQKQDIELISVNDIVRFAHTSRPTFYRYFKDKYDLLNATVLEISHTAFADNPNNYEKQLRECVDILEKSRSLYKNALKYTGQNSIRPVFQKETESMLRYIITSKSYPSYAEIYKLEIKFYSYGITGVLLEWLTDDYKIASKDELVHKLLQMLPVTIKSIII